MRPMETVKRLLLTLFLLALTPIMILVVANICWGLFAPLLSYRVVLPLSAVVVGPWWVYSVLCQGWNPPKMK